MIYLLIYKIELNIFYCLLIHYSKMAFIEKSQSFHYILKKYSTKDKTGITHTRIGNVKEGIFPGKYIIPHEQIEEFYKHYYDHVFKNGNNEYLTEVQYKSDGEYCGPILIDLDFRYDTNITTRQHTDEMIYDLIEIYIKHIQNIFVLNQGIIIPVYIFQKNDVNCCENVTKDGVHIIINIQTPHKIQEILRELMLKDINNVFESLPLRNSYEEVLDKGISSGCTNWQLYGSQKSKQSLPYKCTKKINYLIDNDKNTFDIEFDTVDETIGPQFLFDVSARNSNCQKFELSQYYKDKIEKEKPKPSIIISEYDDNLIDNEGLIDIEAICNISCVEELHKKVQKWIDSLESHEYKLCEIHEYTMILPKEYYDDRNKWIRVGWALRNVSTKLFVTWLLFSSQSEKFSIADIIAYYEQWKSFKPHGVTERSIIWWAKQDNEEGYKQIREKTLGYLIDKTKDSCTEWDIANVIYHYYKEEFRCASIKNNIWYHFQKHRWVENERGNKLRFQISNTISRIFTEKVDYYLKRSVDPELDIKQQDIMKKYAGVYSTIATNLRKTQSKQNIMKEAAEIFYEKDQCFLNNLDKNPYLICFTNGVYDFTENEFRPGRPDDYISLCTNVKYIPISEKSKKQQCVKQEVELFMDQLFPKKSLNKYMWEHLASVIIGINKPQTFNIYNGCGRNGKSKLIELMSKSFGDYVGTVPTSLVTSKRGGVGSLTPEIAQLKGKRYAVMQEPSKDDMLNDGVMKSLTGGDPIQANPKFKDPIVFMPQFKLVVCTNNLFRVKSNDDGTWRRIRLCEFMSRFVENPKKDPKKYEYAIDHDIENKFDTWKEVFISMLVDITKKQQGHVKDCSMVLKASNHYRNDQDYLSQFTNERLFKKTEAYKNTNQGSTKLTMQVLSFEFKTWYQSNFGKNVPNQKEVKSFLEKRLGHNWSVNYDLIYDSDEPDPDKHIIDNDTEEDDEEEISL